MSSTRNNGDSLTNLDQLLSHYHVGVWLINLKRDTGRFAKMDAQLKRIGLPYQLFEAVDGKANAADLVKKVDVEAYERNMGSLLIHFRSWAISGRVHVEI